MPIDIVALITPKPGKAARVSANVQPVWSLIELMCAKVEELLLEAAKAVKANEPGTLRYHLHKETKGDSPTFIMLET